MSTNKNAAIRYQALDKCFRDRRHRYYINDLIDACDEALIYYNGTGGVSRRQIFEDIKFMESETGWSIPLELVILGNNYFLSIPTLKSSLQRLSDNKVEVKIRNFINYI